ncbi:hypothetical protein O3M35_006983 [Rhynocoris fuscipes]|uniref:Uncharacterized protein n=1 Tax=Rhynocoris fuscipes TaxID=488301 RepID=A0AAW1DFN9_9HEMI
MIILQSYFDSVDGASSAAGIIRRTPETPPTCQICCTNPSANEICSRVRCDCRPYIATIKSSTAEEVPKPPICQTCCSTSDLSAHKECQWVRCDCTKFPVRSIQ